ncbi:MAG TPA: LPS export ABC transporter permease LptF [Steroidobacteraceae bacterium]|nr:LPS export ABC transporter permease LptF [Steroidobacteraceae bacterium]
MFATLDRYVFREVTQAWVAVTGVLLAILLSNQLARVLSQAAANQFPRGTVLALLGLTSLQNLTVLVPVGLFLAIMLALGRLYHENEMAAIQSCGVGLDRLYRPVLALAVVICAGLAWLTFVVVPGAAARAQEIRAEALRNAQFGSLEPGRFRSFSGGDVVFYAERVDANGVLYNVFVQRTVGDRVEIATAARAEQRGAGEADQTFILYDGERYEGVPGEGEFRVVRYSEHGIPVRLPQLEVSSRKRDLVPTVDLIGSGAAEDRAELAWRVAVPVMPLVLALLAVPLARLKPRQGRYGKMGVAILVYFVYSNLLAAARVWIEKETMPGWAGLWWVHLVVLLPALWMIVRQTGALPAPRRPAVATA